MDLEAKDQIAIKIKIQPKNIPDIQFSIPVSWTFGQIKEFIFVAHKTNSLQKLSFTNFRLFYTGLLLNDMDTLGDLLEDIEYYSDPLVLYLNKAHDNGTKEDYIEQMKKMERNLKKDEKIVKAVWDSYDHEIREMVGKSGL